MEKIIIDGLFKCPWKILLLKNCEQEKTYLYKLLCQETLYALVVWDQVTLFYEILNEVNIRERLQECNKRLESPVNKVLRHIQESLSNEGAILGEVSLQTLSITLRNKFVGDIPFNWVFNCESNANFTETILNKPMIYSISSLLCENAKLKAIIAQKDTEIEDYKDNGAQVSRPYFETIKFDDAEFEKNLRNSRDFAIALTNPTHESMTSAALNDKLLSTVTLAHSEELKAVAQASPTRVNKGLSSHKKSPKKVRLMHKRNLKPKIRGCVLQEASDEDSSTPISSVAEETPLEIPSKKKKIKKPKRSVF